MQVPVDPHVPAPLLNGAIQQDSVKAIGLVELPGLPAVGRGLDILQGPWFKEI